MMEPIEKHYFNTVHKECFFFSGIEVTLIIPMVPLLKREDTILLCSQHYSNFCVSESVSINAITKPLVIAG